MIKANSFILSVCRNFWWSAGVTFLSIWVGSIFELLFPPTRPPPTRGPDLTHACTHTHTWSAAICNLLVRSAGACPVVRKFPEAWNNSSGCKCHRTEVTMRGSPARLAKRPGWKTSWDRQTREDWRGASGKCSKSWVLEKITFCDRKTSSVFLQRLFITGFSSTCQITRSEGNRRKISYRSDESWRSWKKTNSCRRDPQLPESKGAWKKEKRKRLVKSDTASACQARDVGWGRWHAGAMCAAMSWRELRGEVIPSNCFLCCLAFVT